jgi:sialic acid synthase SpsE
LRADSEGEIITTDHIQSIRPGYGLAPKYMEAILGQKTTLMVKRGTPVSFNLIS